MILDHFRERIALAIARLCKEVTKSKSHITVWDWLYVLPLYNFMKRHGEPFMRPESASTLTLISARAKELEFKDLKNKIPIGYVEYIIDSCSYVIMYAPTIFTDNCRFVDHYPYMEPLFSADPLLLHDFIYLCREGDYPQLFLKIPTYLSLTHLSSLCQELRRFYLDDVGYHEDVWLYDIFNS